MNMNMNVGKYDLLFRGVAGLAGIIFGMVIALVHLKAYGLLIAAASFILMGTALIRWCPIYAFLNLNTIELMRKQKSCSLQ